MDLALDGLIQWDMQEARLASLDLRARGSIELSSDPRYGNNQPVAIAFDLDLEQKARREPRRSGQHGQEMIAGSASAGGKFAHGQLPSLGPELAQ